MSSAIIDALAYIWRNGYQLGRIDQLLEQANGSPQPDRNNPYGVDE
jgi:hypothetical protein